MRQIICKGENISLDANCEYKFLGLTYTVPPYPNYDITISSSESGLLRQTKLSNKGDETSYYLVEVDEAGMDVYILEAELEILMAKQRFFAREKELQKIRTITPCNGAY